jgi:hypothetical protein
LLLVLLFTPLVKALLCSRFPLEVKDAITAFNSGHHAVSTAHPSFLHDLDAKQRLALLPLIITP